MEEAVYICSWERRAKNYEIRVVGHPKFNAEGKTLQDAEDALIDVVRETGGAMTPVFEYLNPWPRSALERRFSSPQLVLIAGNDRLETDLDGLPHPETLAKLEAIRSRVDGLYQSPVCRPCGFSSSPRNSVPHLVRYVNSKYDGAFGGWGARSNLYSEEFLDLLLPAEREPLELLQVNRTSGSRKFYELVGPSGPEFVGVAGLNVTGWQCAACGHREWGYWIKGLSYSRFIASSAIQSVHLSVFTVGLQPNVCLAVTAQRWADLVGRRGTRGIVSEQLGVAPRSSAVRQPLLPTRQPPLPDA